MPDIANCRSHEVGSREAQSSAITRSYIMLASFNTHDYCNPKILAKNRMLMGRWDSEQLAWSRTPLYMRRPGYFSGIDAVLINRKGSLEPVALSDLTGPELDRLLTVPAFVAGGRA
jgi:hypothetical protein